MRVKDLISENLRDDGHRKFVGLLWDVQTSMFGIGVMTHGEVANALLYAIPTHPLFENVGHMITPTLGALSRMAAISSAQTTQPAHREKIVALGLATATTTVMNVIATLNPGFDLCRFVDAANKAGV